MKLDRTINPNKRGKYALLKLRKLDQFTEQGAFGEVAQPIADAIRVLEIAGILDWGLEGSENEFFVIRLRDKNALAALQGYASEAACNDAEFAADVLAMAERAGPYSPFCKKPD